MSTAGANIRLPRRDGIVFKILIYICIIKSALYQQDKTRLLQTPLSNKIVTTNNFKNFLQVRNKQVRIGYH